MRSLADVRARTFKHPDSWWTVLLVDRPASRLLRRAERHRWITPARLSGLSTVLGLGAAVSFAGQSRGWLLLGAALFHLAFAVACLGGGLARLTGGRPSSWSGFLGSRLRAVLCAAALFGGQWAATGRDRYLWLALLVVALDLLRYLHAAELSRSGAVLVAPGGRVKAFLGRHRIRVHLVSGVEFEMAVFVVGPLTGQLAGATMVSAVLLVLFELLLLRNVYRAHSVSEGAAPNLHHIDRQPQVLRPAPDAIRQLV